MGELIVIRRAYNLISDHTLPSLKGHFAGGKYVMMIH